MTTVDAMSAGVVEDTATLVAACKDLASKLDLYNARKDDKVLEPFSKPLAALIGNATTAKEASEAAVVRAYEVLGKQLTDRFCKAAQEFYAGLSVTLETVDVAKALEAYVGLSDLLKVRYLKASFPEDVWNGASDACSQWELVFGLYETTLKAERDSKAPKSYQYNTGRRGTPRPGGRGIGQWVEEHGWKFVATCSNCHRQVTSGSALGSFQNDMAKHWPSCRGENGGRIMLDGAPVDRIMWGDNVPEYAAAHEGFTNAMYAVRDSQDPQVSVDGGGFTITRAYVGQAAA